MRFKLIIVFIADEKTDKVLKAAREAGATGATVINSARGEGLEPAKTFFWFNLRKSAGCHFAIGRRTSRPSNFRNYRHCGWL